MRMVTCIVLFCFFVVGCSSATLITSQPEGASVYLDGVRMGVTPYRYSDTAPLGATKQLRLEYPGYKPTTSVIRKDEFKVGPCIGGVLFLFPFIWLMGYPDAYGFQLEKI